MISSYNLWFGRTRSTFKMRVVTLFFFNKRLSLLISSYQETYLSFVGLGYFPIQPSRPSILGLMHVYKWWVVGSIGYVSILIFFISFN